MAVSTGALQKLLVCFIVPGLDHMGGSVRVAVNIANRLADHYRVALISCAPFEQVAFPLRSDIATYTCNAGEGRLRERVARMKESLTKLLCELKPEVLFGIGTYETLFAIRPCRKAGVKLVFCDHGALINQWDDKQMRIIRLLDALFSVRTVVLTTQSYNDYRTMLHIRACKLRCIPNWVPAVLRNRPISYQGQAKKILWAGRLDKEKGVDHLVDIAARVLPERPDWCWDVYGEVVAGAAIDVSQAVQEAGIGAQLHLMGHVDDMYERYDDYSICTLTSYREGLPLVLLEGKARALPLISFDVNTGPRDIIVSGEDGYLIPCYDCEAYAQKLGEMMSDQDLLARMSAHSDATVDVFSEDAVFQQWMCLLKELGA